MALLKDMTDSEISERFKNDTSFGMMNDDIASDVIARDSVSAASYRQAMIQYFQDKQKFGLWMSPDPAPGE